MAVDAIVRLSFQSNPSANQAANKALVGNAQEASGSGTFQRVGTAAYSCSSQDDGKVALSVFEPGKAILEYHEDLDFLSISYVRKNDHPPLSDNA